MTEHDTPPTYGKPSKNGFTVSRTAALSALVVVLLALSFLAGAQYQKSKHTGMMTAGNRLAMQGQGRFGGPGGFNRGDRAIGTVTAVSSTSITVNTRAGGSKTYTVSSSTTVTNSGQSASVSDIKVGDLVFLTLSSPTSTSVTNIAINPTFGPGGQGTSAPASSTDGSGSGTDSSI